MAPELNYGIAVRGAAQAGMAATRDAQLREARQERRAEAITERVEQLTLLTETLWRLLVTRFGVTEEELQALVSDVRTYREHSETAASTRKCGCGAALGAGIERCVFCGAVVEIADPFERLWALRDG